MTNKTSEQVRSEWVAKTQKTQQQQQYQSMLNSCSAADREAIKALSIIDDQSGGQINRLVTIYNSIKQQFK